MGMDRLDQEAVAGAQSIRRAVSILRVLAAGQEIGVGASEIAAQLNLRRSTVHRMLRVLVEEELAEQEPLTRRYVIGREASLLGLARGSTIGIRSIAAPSLALLCERTGDSAFLTIRSGLDSVCIDRKSGRYPIQVLSVAVGARRPLGVGVAGLVILAGLDDTELREVIRRNERRLARHDLTPRMLMDRVMATRARGYGYSDPGVVPGARTISVAIPDGVGKPIAAISIGAIFARLSSSRAQELSGLMREQASAISRRLRQADRSPAGQPARDRSV